MVWGPNLKPYLGLSPKASRHISNVACWLWEGKQQRTMADTGAPSDVCQGCIINTAGNGSYFVLYVLLFIMYYTRLYYAII